MPALKPLIAEIYSHTGHHDQETRRKNTRFGEWNWDIETAGKKKKLMISGLNETQDQSVEQDVMKLYTDKLQNNRHLVDVDSIVRLTRKTKQC